MNFDRRPQYTSIFEHLFNSRMSPKLSVRKERDNRRRGSLSKIDQAGRDEIDKNIILSKRLGLDYGKLFRDDEGGYDVETLQTALDKM